MKKFFTLFTALLVVMTAGAEVWEIDTNTTDALRVTLGKAKDGDVIVMAAGTYVESNSNYIAFNKNITVKAADGAEVIVQPKVPATISEGKRVKIIGIKFDAQYLQTLATWYEHVIYASDNHDGNILVLENCEFYNHHYYPYVNDEKQALQGSSTIYCASGNKLDSCIVNNCKFHDITKSCLFFENTGMKGLIVTNSSFYNIARGSTTYYHAGIIDPRTISGKVLVDHCTFYNCMAFSTDYGAVKAVSSNALVSNSIFMLSSSSSDFRAIHMPDGNHVDNCLTYNYAYESAGGIRSGNVKSNCKLNVDPLFTNAASANFTLQTSPSASPALQAASDGSHMGDPRWWPVGSNIHVTPGTDVSTYVAPGNLNFSGITGLKAYVATSANASEVTMTEVGAVPEGTPLVLVGTAGTTYDVPVVAAASTTAPTTNLLCAGDGYTTFSGSTYDYIIWTDGKFHQISGGIVARGKAYLHLTGAPSGAPGLRIVFETDNATDIHNIETNEKVTKFFQNGQLLISRDGITYDALGRVIR